MPSVRSSPSKRKRSMNKTKETPSPSDEPEESSSSLGEDYNLEIELGDNVLLQVSDNLFVNNGGSVMVARVEKTWKERSKRRFRARWFFSKQNMDGLFHGTPSLQQSFQQTSNRISDRDLILTNQYDDNAVDTICGKVEVVYRKPNSDKNFPSLPNNTYVCRYAVTFGVEGGKVDENPFTPFEGEEDDWSEILTGNTHDCKRRRVASSSSPEEMSFNEATSNRSFSDSDSCSTESQPRGIGEGTIGMRNTRVGSEHQVEVPESSKRGQQEVLSRNPKLVWQAKGISQDKLNMFLEQVSEILYPYLKETRFTQEEPYSPLAWDKMETKVKATGSNSLPTLSSLCTCTSLSGSSKSMLREFDSDSILEMLHDNNYETDRTLAVIKESPEDFSTLWSAKEKEIFNSRFRKHAGSLRMVWKGISSSKNFHDIVDYHYRFKIPDQFRCLQMKKREEAVRMVESIDARRNINSIIPIERERNISSEEVDDNQGMVKSKWNITGIGDIKSAVRTRRSNAKELLIDIETKLGKEKMMIVVGMIRNFHQISTSALLSDITKIFEGDEDLMDRFTDFLPRH